MEEKRKRIVNHIKLYILLPIASIMLLTFLSGGMLLIGHSSGFVASIFLLVGFPAITYLFRSILDWKCFSMNYYLMGGSIILAVAGHSSGTLIFITVIIANILGAYFNLFGESG